MRKVLVIGCPGAGKSTFSRALRDKTGLSLYYLDMLWHTPDKNTVGREEFDKRLNEIIGRDSWIIDGNYGRTLEMRLKACDTVFLFDLPVEICLSGAQARIGAKREDMPWIEEVFDPEFRQWIVDFPKNELPHIYSLLERYKDKSITVFTSRAQAKDYLNSFDLGRINTT